MGSPEGLEHAVLSLPFDRNSSTIQGEYAFEYLAHEILPWVIGCTGLVKILLAIIYALRPQLPRFFGSWTWLARIIGTGFDVLVCFGSLIRINLSYHYLAIVPLIVIFFIGVLRTRKSQMSGQAEKPEAAGHLITVMLNPETCSDVKSRSSKTGTDDAKKKVMARSGKRKNQQTGTGIVKSGSSRTCTDDGKKKMMAWKKNGKKSNVKFNVLVHLNNGLKTRVIPEKFNVALLLAPHMLLTVSGVVGDAYHDWNHYNISNFFLFLTCMLQELTLIACRIAPVSELLYKASLVVLLFTAHILAINAFGNKVVLLLLPEVMPPLLWHSLHLDRRTPIIKVQRIVGSEHNVFKAVLVAMCGCMLQVVPRDSSLLYWVSTSCTASGLITCIIVLVLRLWPEKAGFATLSFEDVVDLLTFWGKLLLQVAVGLFAFGVVFRLRSTLRL